MSSLRVAIQSRILSAIKAGVFTPIIYGSDGIPVEGPGTESASVICNEIGGDLDRSSGQSNKYVLRNWRFETTISFKREVDVSEFLMGFNLTFSHEGVYAVTVGLDSTYTPEHPVTNGAHGGTKCTVIFIANVKR